MILRNLFTLSIIIQLDGLMVSMELFSYDF